MANSRVGRSMIPSTVFVLVLVFVVVVLMDVVVLLGGGIIVDSCDKGILGIEPSPLSHNCRIIGIRYAYVLPDPVGAINTALLL